MGGLRYPSTGTRRRVKGKCMQQATSRCRQKATHTNIRGAPLNDLSRHAWIKHMVNCTQVATFVYPHHHHHIHIQTARSLLVESAGPRDRQIARRSAGAYGQRGMHMHVLRRKNFGSRRTMLQRRLTLIHGHGRPTRPISASIQDDKERARTTCMVFANLNEARSMPARRSRRFKC